MCAGIQRNVAGPGAEAGGGNGDIALNKVGVDVASVDDRGIAIAGVKHPAGETASAVAGKNRDVGRVEQPVAVGALTGTGIDTCAADVKRTFARGFNQAAIAALRAAFGLNMTIGARGVVGPNDRRPASTN